MRLLLLLHHIICIRRWRDINRGGELLPLLQLQQLEARLRRNQLNAVHPASLRYVIWLAKVLCVEFCNEQ